MVVTNHSSTVLGKMYEGPMNGDFVRYVDQLLADNARRSGAMASSQALTSTRQGRQDHLKPPQATVGGAAQLLERLKQSAQDGAKAKDIARLPEAFGRKPLAQESGPVPGWVKALGWLILIGLGIALPPLGIMLVLHFVGRHMRAAKK